MATELTTGQAMDAAKAAKGVAWLKHLSTLSATDKLPAKAEIDRVAALLDQPANDAWVTARVLALLSPYFEKDTPQAVRRIEANDWAVAMAGFPQWAIENAVRWWKSDENPDRRKRPLEGDIVARCKIEVMPVRYGPQVTENKRRAAMPEPERHVSAEDREHRAKVAAELMAKFNGTGGQDSD